jgi:SAM-dependent methyltransferase
METSSEKHVCPSCGTLGITPFYEAMDVPISSCLMFSSREEAISFPRGNVILGFCTHCGFISNIAFDPTKVDYWSLDPEEQGSSATFNAYAQRLAKSLIQTYNLNNKYILEIGCGRGDFLALLCELGNNFGVGIDPSSITGEIQSTAADRLTFIRDFYSERYAKYSGDLICCRHTLEHIYNTENFVHTVRRAISNNLETAVFFEVPDISRILQEVAFWDIYYEHCSYFSLGSLARLFRFCNFEVSKLKKDYFDQYLLIEAKPVNDKSETISELEERVEEIAKQVASFSQNCQNKLDMWKNQIQIIRTENKKAIVWGSGSKCVAFMTTLGIKDEIQYIVDINPRRHGKFIPGVGKEIVAPEYLIKYQPDTVIVMNPAYCEEIKQSLDDMGLAPEIIPCT